MADNSSSSLVDTAIKIVDIVGELANITLKGERTVAPVVAVLSPLLGPYGPAIVGALAVADPIIAKIAAVTPAIESAIEAGRPVIEIAQAQGPVIVRHVKDVLAAFVHHGALNSEDVTDGAVAAFGWAMLSGTKLQSVFEASYFTPQDPRFNRVDTWNSG